LRSIGLLLPLILALPGTVLAQELPTTELAQEETGDTWFPSARYFARPLASNREPVFALRLLESTLFRGRSTSSERSPFDFPGQDGLDVDVQGEAALGGAFRIWQPLRWSGGGLILGLQAGVFGRFRLEVSSSDLVASDWIVSLPAEVARGPWSAQPQDHPLVAAMGPRRCDVERWHRLASQRPGGVGESDFGAFRADDARRRGFEVSLAP